MYLGNTLNGPLDFNLLNGELRQVSMKFAYFSLFLNQICVQIAYAQQRFSVSYLLGLFLLQALIKYIKGLNLDGAILVFLPGWNLIFALLKYLSENPVIGNWCC